MHKTISTLILLLFFFCLSTPIFAQDNQTSLDQALEYLRVREDSLALHLFENILKSEPFNLEALWGKAEIYRRSRKFKEAERIAKNILSKVKDHPGSMITLAYINYYKKEFKDALRLLKRVLKNPELDKQEKALTYMLIGSINAAKATQGGLLSKITSGTHIGGYFEKAKKLAPELPEVRLGLGTFCLIAPKLIGGNLEKAKNELECALELAPNFATVSARLAQFYKKIEDFKNYNLYYQRAKSLDPENEVIKILDNENE